MSVRQRLDELRITLPEVGPTLGNYVHARRVGNLLYLSGKGPEQPDGTMPKGFLVEPEGLAGAQDITSFGGWRAYVAATTKGG